MKKTVKTIGLFGKYQDVSIVPHIVRLGEFLRARGLSVLLDENTGGMLERPFAPSRPLAAIGREIDLAIVIGGDGTMLNVARALADSRVPLIGVNLGRLGFLTDIAADNMPEAIGKILDGDFHTEQRLLLAAEIMRKGRIVHTARAFNDVIVNKGELARLIEFETYINGEFVNSTRGDGVIVSSPTGSTAYALSAGGPILHPALPAIVLVPICPHTLSNRPIVVSSDSVIEIVMTGLAANHANVAFDGQSTFALDDNDRIYVRRLDTPVELIHPSGRSHYDVLRTKLHWGEKF
ncbi:MAG: NAD kinase [Candidatus Muproteobacteria bacterium RIFCSPHIGHO2_01_FULL_65_16]|uniref:NAD kinase n=3 Tax=Candidatus Muproteobacteria TaxID=1817795 RepID=A0A1F6TEH3_9PROT|nr:MAG: NAD kinase [Candidatus Muproteobacteria bacterium RBG_16_65_31]OGI46289.1 MAG: NAD kinase [Candidatus Muproteobacteria bacterium RIFCSPHIGHO2_01_FULL_65_16]OGI50973.1 MAG: NAD kinase [Candidatus Muproteobacteria bacterium RIFCSPHIGHO2_02_FULL_65_16]